ncbi:outer membrane beta-barrel family protein [Prevotella intermedia]|uniref:outer membrane beta-barrel family protein n=1 Tax=Prevotella intermedia TaxID=28131 RepID=UPI001E555806|nr:outer membrane beta-barrel family protein [Prevotella intermedia]
MKRFFALFLIAMAGQNALYARHFALNTAQLQYDLTQTEVSDTVQTDRKEKPVELSEVTVEAARVVQKPDGQLIFPSKAQCNNSANGYSLLAKLGLSRIRVDEVTHSITALNSNGDVQIRINGVVATKTELTSMNPKLVKSIEFIDNPGVRYGENVGYVLNIRTARSERGGAVGVDLSNSLTALYGDNTAYAKFNRGNSEVSLSYSFDFQDFKRNRMKETADYLLNNNTRYRIVRTDLSSRNRQFGNNFQLKYSLADSASYVFQANLSSSFSHNPNADRIYQTFTPEGNFLSESNGSKRSFSPALDLYYYRKLGKSNSITANLVGTAIETKADDYLKEVSPYIYNVDGRMRSLYSELIYEQQLRPFTVSMGINGSLKHIRNEYLGDVKSLNRMDYSTLYMFSEVKGQWQKLGYVFGIGATHAGYKQATDKYNYWLFRPKLTLSYQVSQAFSVRYNFEIHEHISRIAMISNTKIRENSREWRVGNPNIEPNKVVRQMFSFSYVRPRFYNMVDILLQVNTNPNMSKYVRTADDQFYYMQANQKRIAMFCVMDNFNFKIIPDVLELTLSGGVYRFINEGDDYKHSLTACNFQASMQAYLGRWTLSAYADNGWKFNEGETLAHNGGNVYVGGSYRLGNLQLSLYIQNPFMQHPKTYHTHILNRYVTKDIVYRSRENGNLLNFSLSWNLEFGHRKHNDKQRNQHKDTDTGIM